MNNNELIDDFWNECRASIDGLPVEVPEAWAFGATPAHADELLALVLEGTKTATASSLWDHQQTGEPVAEVGLWNIILDGQGRPRALLETTAVHVVPFDEVTEAHAHAEGEGDRTLASWRDVHERYWTQYSDNPRGYEHDMPVVCEEFVLRFSCA